jgi:proline dehydrogenase
MDFNNTQIAFAYKSDAELKKARFLFGSLNIPGSVFMGKMMLKLVNAFNIPAEGIIKKSIFSHFCGGENLENCVLSVHNLSAFGIKSILDLSIEGQKNEEAFDQNEQLLAENLSFSGETDATPVSVFKVTALGSTDVMRDYVKGYPFTADQERIFQRVHNLMALANEKDISVLIDAEETWLQNFIDEVTERLMVEFNKKRAVVIQTIQLYRKDKLEYLQYLYHFCHSQGLITGVKLVRGAYMEKERLEAKQLETECLIQDDKAACDDDFNSAIKFCVQHINDIVLIAATHNENSCQLLIELMKKAKLNKSHPHVWFAQLYGMSDNLSFNLSSEGYNVAKYLPYGPVMEVMPYLLRRAEENSSAQNQSARELQLIRDELKRRRTVN